MNAGMGHEAQFYVTDTYPDSIAVMLGSRKINLSYEELKRMDAEFIMSEPVTKEAVEWVVTCYVDEPTDDAGETTGAIDILWMVYLIANKKWRQAYQESNSESDLVKRWAEIERKLADIVNP